jgi:hypothetical protein
MTILFDDGIPSFQGARNLSRNKIVISTEAHPDFLPRSAGHGHERRSR